MELPSIIVSAHGQDLDRRRRSHRTPLDAKAAASQTIRRVNFATYDGGLFGEYGTQ
jgi:hypothetical protein